MTVSMPSPLLVSVGRIISFWTTCLTSHPVSFRKAILYSIGASKISSSASSLFVYFGSIVSFHLLQWSTNRRHPPCSISVPVRNLNISPFVFLLLL